MALSPAMAGNHFLRGLELRFQGASAGNKGDTGEPSPFGSPGSPHFPSRLVGRAVKGSVNCQTPCKRVSDPAPYTPAGLSHTLLLSPLTWGGGETSGDTEKTHVLPQLTKWSLEIDKRGSFT